MTIITRPLARMHGYNNHNHSISIINNLSYQPKEFVPPRKMELLMWALKSRKTLTLVMKNTVKIRKTRLTSEGIHEGRCNSREAHDARLGFPKRVFL